MPPEILPLVKAVNQALDRLELGFRSQREFAADAAHELRTPLAILRTRIETLPHSEASRALGRDVENMSRVVSQLLDATELETAIVDPESVADLHEVGVEIAEFIAPLALKRGKSIELIGVDKPVLIVGNAEMIRRATRNLVENALHHTPEGTAIEIVVGQDGSISVIDNGDGVPPENRESIFKRFWRRSTRASGGAGLGLSIVKKIVEAHHGSITVEDAPGRGARFIMRFPLLVT
jgi:signal transduction histidine kinase